ncbi:MAG: cytidylate kinase family protein [Candidatus Moraniibacteriota bacterium]
MIITITGEPGSGKSTIGKKLAQKLNYKHYYIGQIRRDAAKKKGMTLAEYNKYGETHPETDIEVDDYQKNLGEKENNFVIEGRTSWFLIPHSLKIYISVNPLEGAKRVFKELQSDNNRNEDHALLSVEDVLKSHTEREASDALRYQKYYGKNCSDKSNFDLMVDTTNLNQEEAFNEVWNHLEAKIK